MSFLKLVDEYPNYHQNRANKVLHWIGIPSIIIGIVLVLKRPWLGLGFILFGSTLLGIGHRIEGRKPAFFDNLGHLLAGPVWQLREIGRAIKRLFS